ncbi:MAG: ribokinase [Eubacteriales bacterium]|nr:ribokinase [Eubacteriales bacterium]
MKVLNFGSLNVDYVYQVDHMVAPGETLAAGSRNIFCGGKGLNQSIGLAKAGAPVYHAGMIGEGGDILLDMLKENQVNTEFVRKTDGPCGHTVIQVDKNGQNSILLFGGSNRTITKEFVDEVLSSFGKEDYLVLQNEINELAYIIDKAYEAGMTIVLNPSPYDDNLKECDLSKVSIFLINEVEGFQISGEKEAEKILGKMQKDYPDAAVVLTLGGEGSVYRKGDKTCHQGIYKVKAVDTTAAGDTFTGFFLTALIEQKSAEEALDLAAKASAIAVTRPGAAGSIPVRAEVEAWKGTDNH